MSATTQPPTPLHAFLSRHQILFVTITATLLSIASVVVACLQWGTARLQSKIALRKEQPNFVITADQIWNSEESRITDEEIHIQNFGGPAHELRERVTTFLKVSLQKGGKSREVSIPLTGFFTASAVSVSAVNGLLVRCHGYRNDDKISNLARAFRDFVSTKGYDFGNVEVVRYTALWYYDLFDERHGDYFVVKPIDGAIRLSSDEDKDMVNQFDSKFQTDGGVDLDKLTAETLFESIENLRAKR